MTTNQTPAHTATCQTPDVFVVNGGTEFHCNTCQTRSDTGFVATTSVAEGQFK